MTDVLARITDYAALVAAIRARRVSLGLSQLAVDDMAGLPTGYTAKIEAMLTNPQAPNARNIGWQSLPLLLGALRLEIAVMRSPASHSKSGPSPIAYEEAMKKVMAERGRLGGRIRVARLGEVKVRQSARHAARIRWRKWREQKARQNTKVRRQTKADKKEAGD
ncbi:hypothetical protein [Chelatococcus sp. XZ-Ab1]|uniref:helix-turn-helix domain-containing protein n=1 Tax=Chelatococcus sp. XZ-Ab1 TaxID=3034027 RepID=UPI0023E3FB94|nr:hypothetical protein [Chelatococcus sp. XZ-Ab1]